MKFCYKKIIKIIKYFIYNVMDQILIFNKKLDEFKINLECHN